MKQLNVSPAQWTPLPNDDHLKLRNVQRSAGGDSPLERQQLITMRADMTTAVIYSWTCITRHYLLVHGVKCNSTNSTLLNTEAVMNYFW